MQGEADIRPGICGFRTIARAESNDGQTVDIAIETDCPNVTRLVDALAEKLPLDAYKEIDPRAENTLLVTGRESRCCTDCIVPASALKAMRVATELAFAKDASVAMSGG